MEPTGDLTLEAAQARYGTQCARAVLGYLGYAAHHERATDALQDPRIAPLLRSVIDETGRALLRWYELAPKWLLGYEADLLAGLQALSPDTTCRELAHDPIRQLEAGGPLVGAARLCERAGVVPVALAWAIAAALFHDDPDDAAARTLRQTLRQYGALLTLLDVSGIATREPLARQVEEAIQTANLRVDS